MNSSDRWRLVAALMFAAAASGVAQAQTSADSIDADELLSRSLAVEVRSVIEARSPFEDGGPAYRIQYDPVLWRVTAPRRALSHGRAGWKQIRLVVSIGKRTVLGLVGTDTVFQAPVGVASGLTLSFGGRTWKFRTPRGGRRVLRKTPDPVWTPPDWHYAEVARDNGLSLSPIPGRGVRLRNGDRLVVRHGAVGVLFHGRDFAPLPQDEHVVFGDKLYIPPYGTQNRRIQGELGNYALDLGDGYMIHGTPDEATVGKATTHGCIRMRGEDLAWLADHVPVGARVVIQ